MVPRDAPVAVQKPIRFPAVSVEGPYDLCCGRSVVSEYPDSGAHEERTAVEEYGNRWQCDRPLSYQ